MATQEEIQKLVMQVEGERELKKLVDQQTKAEKVMGKLVEQFEQGKITQQDYAKRTEIVATQILRLREKAGEAEASLGKLGGATRQYGHEMRQLGYITQDFAQGGFGAILNNIDGLLYKFPALAGAATMAATAIWAFGPPLKQFVEGLIAGSNQIPPTTDRLEKLNEQVKANAERLNELKGKQALTNAELKEYNEILAAQTGLEREANDERERRNALEAQLRKEREPTADQTAGGGVISEKLIEAGGAETVIDRITRTMTDAGDADVIAAEAKLEKLSAEFKKIGEMPADLIADEYARVGKAIEETQAELEAATRAIRERAEYVVQGALQGDLTQIVNLASIMPGKGFEGATPAGLKAAQEAADKEARSRQFNADQARRAVGNWLYRNINPIATGMRDDRAAQAAARQHSLNIAAEMTEAHKGQQAADKQAAQAAAQADRVAAREAAEAPKRAREAQLAEIGEHLNRATGGQMTEAQIAGAARSTQQLMDRGVEPMAAAQMALSEVVQANEQLMARMAALEAGFRSVAEHQRAMRIQNSQRMGGQMTGGYSQLPMYMGGM